MARQIICILIGSLLGDVFKCIKKFIKEWESNCFQLQLRIYPKQTKQTNDTKKQKWSRLNFATFFQENSIFLNFLETGL